MSLDLVFFRSFSNFFIGSIFDFNAAKLIYLFDINTLFDSLIIIFIDT